MRFVRRPGNIEPISRRSRSRVLADHQAPRGDDDPRPGCRALGLRREAGRQLALFRILGVTSIARKWLRSASEPIGEGTMIGRDDTACLD
jgi:hypothetical protein